ncbi:MULTISPECIES: PepSY-associated TM helix domain-containing protein [unclassified Helicobacter]|uniref:PepSY-associated TM helix domain-containing protein n=1 Tax=unclassified Helicobacter TaxID=2593540 RepID=UPI000CF05009|nr:MULTISPECIES: PepSY-associated TM helix domain-containing protein [unclassified Helicobacter]
MKKSLFRKIHIYASVFFLPMAIIFSLTGVLYIFGIDQNYKLEQKKYEIIQKEPVENLQKFVLDFLVENNIPLPSNTELKNGKRGMSMGSTKYFISIEQKPNQITIQTNKRSFYGNLMMLHKAKVGKAFQIFSIIFGIALLVFYFSGFIITSWCKQHRKESVIFLILGILVTSILGYISV